MYDRRKRRLAEVEENEDEYQYNNDNNERHVDETHARGIDEVRCSLIRLMLSIQ